MNRRQLMGGMVAAATMAGTKSLQGQVVRPEAVQGSAPKKRHYYGVTIGILMVKTEFERFPGDVGNAETWPFPVQYRVVDEATPATMGTIRTASLLEPFKRAAQELIEAGVDGIATTCGFLALYQKELTDSLSVPVATSSLLQVPIVQRLLPAHKRVGVLTFSAEELSNKPYFANVGVDPDTPIGGMPPTSEFVRSIRQGDNTVSEEVLRREVVAAAGALLKTHPDIGAIVLECTNLTPYSASIHEAYGLPVYDVVTLIKWFHSGLQPQHFREA